ncbi:toxin-antitoxin system YwqK family antitoxin [Hymenobacter coccineus]|uniref:toxin-antitoxin system YwqK family antitoxin n=1 Tax=Hymenobacter coccineus TaxID=1908235 RepID=UPI000AFEE6A0|nr:hypothetical protein [Hymenobacter coccineus]
MRCRSLLLLSLLLCGACASNRPAANRTDRHGRSQGRWRTYYDEAARTQPFTAGRYRHGRPVGTFRYYGPTGALAQTERYGREGYCEVTYWYPGGQVERRGKAQWLTGAKGARFYWFGPWTRYTETGQVRAVETYTNGSHTATDVYQAGRLTTTEIYKNGQLIETRPVQ